MESKEEQGFSVLGGWWGEGRWGDIFPKTSMHDLSSKFPVRLQDDLRYLKGFIIIAKYKSLCNIILAF